VPRLRSKEELMREVKYTKSWKGGGNKNDYFQQPPVMKPKILDEWTLSRVQAPERAFKKFFFRKLGGLVTSIVKQKPFQYTNSKTEEFGAGGEEALSTHYRDYLQDQKKKFTVRSKLG
jgi:hypothetical protein